MCGRTEGWKEGELGICVRKVGRMEGRRGTRDVFGRDGRLDG